MSDQEIDLPEGFGTFNPNAGSYERFKLPKENGSLILRVLPPMKSLARRGECGLYWKSHFGWNGRDPITGKTAWRPWLCIEEKRGGMTICVCGGCEARYKVEAKIKAIETVGKERGKSDGEIKKAIAPHAEWLYNHSCNGKFRMPVVDLQDKCGILEIPWGLSKKFKDKVREATAKGMDPIGVKGIYWEFKRTGRASPQSDDVYPYQIPIEGVDGGFRVKTHVLTKTLAQQALDVIPDLYELMEKGRIRPDQIDALAACSGDPDEVDRILEIDHSKANKGWSSNDEAPKADSVSAGDDAFATDAVSKSEVKPTQALDKSKVESTEDDEEAQLQKQLAALKAKKAAKTQAAPKSEPKKVELPSGAVDESEYDGIFGS